LLPLLFLALYLYFVNIFCFWKRPHPFQSQRELNSMRNTFWDTRVEGSTQMWQNIRSAAEALAANDVPLANAILEVSDALQLSFVGLF
jgi:hypothetical protein